MPQDMLGGMSKKERDDLFAAKKPKSQKPV